MSANTTTDRPVAAEFPLAHASGACLMLRGSCGTVTAAVFLRDKPLAVTATGIAEISLFRLGAADLSVHVGETSFRLPIKQLDALCDFAQAAGIAIRNYDIGAAA